MKIARTIACLVCLSLGGWTHGTKLGLFVLNLDTPGSTGYAFMNFFKATNSIGAGTYAFPAILNSDQYPVSTPSTAITTTTNIPATACYSAATCFVKWTGAGAVQLSGAATVTSDPQSCVQSYSSNLLLAGTNCNVQFTFNSAPSTVTVTFPTSCSPASCPGTWTMSNAIFALQSNYNCIVSGAGCTPSGNQIFNPDYLAVLSSKIGAAPSGTSLNPAVLRFLNWNNASNSNVVSYSNIAATTNFSYTNAYFGPTYWAGTITSSDGASYTAGCSGGCTCPGSLTNGIVVQGIIGHVSSTTTPTLNYCTLGAATIVTQSISALGASTAIALNAIQTFTYDAALNEWIWSGAATTGLKSAMPISVMTALCNATQTGCWIAMQAQLDDASVTSFAAAVAAGLNTFWIPEYSNEPWLEASNVQSHWFQAIGGVMQFPIATFGTTQQLFDYYALRRYQVMQLVQSAWAAAGKPSSALYSVQTVQDNGTVSQVENNWLLGVDLTLDGTTNCGSLPCYTTSAPVTNFSSGTVGGTPSQGYPLQTIKYLSYAPYLNGAQITQGSYPCANPSGTPSCYYSTTSMANAIAAADNYANGGVGIASALAFVDGDVRSGTINGNCGTTSSPACSTLAYLAANVYQKWDTLAEKYSTSLGGSGPIIGIIQYEGGFQEIGPTTTQVTANQLVSAPGGNCLDYTVPSCLANEFATLIAAYKNSSYAAQLVLDDYHQFMSCCTYKSSLMPAWYELGPDTTQWGTLLQTNLYATPWQFYFGVATFAKGGWLLNRDLDPASNDNSPAFMDKAA